MNGEYGHLSDENLLLFADGEMSSRRSAEAEAHLAACWECRARRKRLEETVADFVEIHHQALDPRLPPSAGPRALLKARLAESAAQSDRHSWLQQLPFVFARYKLAYLGVMFLVVVCGTVIGRRVLSQVGPASARLRFAAQPVPNRYLTPGVARPVSTTDVCMTEYSDDTRAVPTAIRQRVFQEYGMAGRRAKGYELDYLISPDLGGTDDIRNLWPEPASDAEWNMRAKDDLENRLHQMVCEGSINLSTAQRDLSTDWISAYKRYFRTDRPLKPL
jgi:hypothetical protein